MKNKLDKFIKEQGWSIYGIIDIETATKALKKHRKIYDEWVKKGFQADLDYLKRMQEDRFNPENKVPGAKSIIVLSASYCGLDYGPESRTDCGLVAKYACGRDYHKVLKRKLNELSSWLKEQDPGAKTYTSVDSGPTVDRVLAETAGLGFFGKNSNIIDPSNGSYFFIANLITNMKINPTENKRMPNCGDCDKCQKICPTGAFAGPGVIDARKCISYLTIENKEGIPTELRPKMGNRIFGCDACQECCPFNVDKAQLQEILIDGLKSENGVGALLDLKRVLEIETDEDFNNRFIGTPIMRTKRRGLIRNACVVAGNSGDQSLIPYLEKIINQEEDEMIKEHASWALEQL